MVDPASICTGGMFLTRKRANNAVRADWVKMPTGQWRTELREMVRLAVPIVLTQLAWVSMMITDTAMIGRLGAEPLAGASLSLMLFFLTWLVCFGVVTATAGLSAQAYGARNPRLIRRVVRQGLWVAIVLSVPALVLLSRAAPIFEMLGQPVETLGHAQAYMSTLMWTLPWSIAFAVLRNFVAALNRPTAALWVMLGGVPLNAALDYGLIFGNFGLPRLELVGAGIATATANAALFVALIAIAVLARPFRRYAVLGRFWRPDWTVFRRIFRIGIPIAGMMLLEGGFFVGAVFIIGQFGTVALAAHMIAIQLPHLSFMVPMGLAQAATVRVGQAAGRRDHDGAYRAGWTAMALIVVFMTVMTAVVLAVPEIFASAFLDPGRADSAAVFALAVSFLFYAAFFQAADGLQAVAAGALRGLNDTATPMVIAVVCYWGIGLAAGLWFAFEADLGPAGLWLGFIFALTTAGLMLLLRFRRLARGRFLPVVEGQRA